VSVHTATAAARYTLRDLFIALRERLVVTLPLAALCAVLYAYHKQSQPPVYRAAAVLQVERPERIVTTQAVVETAVNSDVDFNTYLQRFSTDSLRNRVLKSLTPAERERLSAPGAPPDAPPDLGTVGVSAVPRTLIIRLICTHRDPAAAAFVANRFAREFIDQLRDEVGDKNEFAVDYLRERAGVMLQDANAAEQRLQDYMRRHNLVSLDSSTNITATRLNLINNALQTSRLDRLALEEQCRLIEEQRQAGRNLLEISAISRHGAVSDHAAQLERLRREEILLSETYLAKHPRRIAIAQTIATTRTQLAGAIDLAVAELQTALTKARETENNLTKEFAQQEKELLRLRELAVEYKGLESMAQVAKSSHAAVLARLNETTTGKALTKSPVSVVDLAKPPAAPAEPNPAEITRNAVFIALIVLLLVTIVLSHLDDRIKSTHDIEEILGETVLGLIPRMNQTSDKDRFQMVLSGKDPGRIEPFMNLHAAADLNSGLPFPRSLLVTSTIPGEGKTVVSANLAASFAAHGQKVLIIDCDLRRPMLHERFGQPNEAGLLKWYLTPAADHPGPLPENPLLGIRSIGPNLDIITSGGRSNHPTPLFESPRFAALIAELKGHYNLILIDTPPLGAVSDALYISKIVDELIYVCRFNCAQRRHIRTNLRALRTSRSKILGLVLNDISRRSLPYYSDYRYYASYEKYYGQAA